ncbi:MAG: glycoside hydrolase family 97 N-terminal domain-containing protein, partial [Bacteroidia bacterium]
MYNFLAVILGLFLLGNTCQKPVVEENMPLQVSSPNEYIQVDFLIGSFGRPGYTVSHKGSAVIDTSFLGFYFKNTDNLDHFLSPVSSSIRKVDERWKPALGKDTNVRNQYNELKVNLEEGVDRQAQMTVVFRVYDDGIGFRYEIPAQPGLPDSLLIDNEVTNFNLTGDHACWWIPGDWSNFEHTQTYSKLSEIDASVKRNQTNPAETYIPDSLAVNTPVTMRTTEGLYLSFHEANLTNYPDMTLHIDPENFNMYCSLVAWPDGIKMGAKLPMKTPWRT